MLRVYRAVFPRISGNIPQPAANRPVPSKSFRGCSRPVDRTLSCQGFFIELFASAFFSSRCRATASLYKASSESAAAVSTRFAGCWAAYCSRCPCFDKEGFISSAFCNIPMQRRFRPDYRTPRRNYTARRVITFHARELLVPLFGLFPLFEAEIGVSGQTANVGPVFPFAFLTSAFGQGKRLGVFLCLESGQPRIVLHGKRVS